MVAGEEGEWRDGDCAEQLPDFAVSVAEGRCGVRCTAMDMLWGYQFWRFEGQERGILHRRICWPNSGPSKGWIPHVVYTTTAIFCNDN